MSCGVNFDSEKSDSVEEYDEDWLEEAGGGGTNLALPLGSLVDVGRVGCLGSSVVVCWEVVATLGGVNRLFLFLITDRMIGADLSNIRSDCVSGTERGSFERQSPLLVFFCVMFLYGVNFRTGTM